MMAAGTKPGGFNRQKKIVLIGEKHQSLSLTSFRLSLQPIHLQCQEMTGPPHFSPRPSVSIMPISPQTNDSPEWPFSQNWLPSPTKASVPAMVNLAPTGPPPEVATDGWSLPQPSSPRATLSFLAGEHLRKRGPGRGGGRAAEGHREGHREGHKRARTQGNANSSALANASVGILWEQRSPRRAGSASLLSLFPAPARRRPRSRRGASAPWPQKPTAAQWPRWPGSDLAFFLAPFHQPFSPPPSPGALSKEVASRDERRRRGEI